jgi:hypothetical protein
LFLNFFVTAKEVIDSTAFVRDTENYSKAISYCYLVSAKIPTAKGCVVILILFSHSREIAYDIDIQFLEQVRRAYA